MALTDKELQELATIQQKIQQFLLSQKIPLEIPV